MDYDELWQRVKSAIRQLEPSGENPDEYPVYVGARAPRCNRVRIFDDYLERISDGPNSKLQRISKDDIIVFANLPIEAPNRTFAIDDLELKPRRLGYMGSIVCTILALLDDFDHLPGQRLVFKQQ
jgi:hypothetical protein